jgi:hypothetical protein
MDDDDLLFLLAKIAIFSVICLGLGALFAHWLIWGGF